MLQFGSGSGSDVPDPGICNEQAPYAYGKSKVSEAFHLFIYFIKKHPTC